MHVFSNSKNLYKTLSIFLVRNTMLTHKLRGLQQLQKQNTSMPTTAMLHNGETKYKREEQT